MTTDLLCLGLGNPGPEYTTTRHNVGFGVIDALAARRACTLRRSLRAQAWIGRCALDAHTILLARPTTFMNASGRAYAALVRQDHPHTTVICSDDLDLPIGKLRLVQGGSSGGHRGVQSIIDAGGIDTIRLRIGIGTNRTASGHRIPAEQFVLQRFTAAEQSIIDRATTEAVETILLLAQEGFPAAQQYAHTRSTPSP
ncbi:aminoacyl-tRNA hydrolase [Candidatus Uhrbacteria bacterium]|nr:aminoacyl-tRNA hydrolase [Candidatus Uhrbacteria bacterium]